MKPNYSVTVHDNVFQFDRISVVNEPSINNVAHWHFHSNWDAKAQTNMTEGAVAVWKIKWK